MNEEQLSYVRTQLERGVTPDDLQETLLQNGYTEQQARALIQRAQAPLAEPVTGLAPTVAFIQSCWSTSTQHLNFIVRSTAILIMVSMVGEVLRLSLYEPEMPTLLLDGFELMAGLFVFIMALYVTGTAKASITDASSYAASTYFSYFWILILSVALTFLGFIALIVPGIILVVYFYLDLVVRMREGTRGFAALKRSLDIVYGHWWVVFARVFVFGLSLVPLVLTAGIVAIIGVSVLDDVVPESITVAFFASLPSGLVMLLSAVVMHRLYEGLTMVSAADTDTSGVVSDAEVLSETSLR